MIKHFDFKSLLEEAEKTPAYLEERAMLDFTEEMVAQMNRQKISRTELARRMGCSRRDVTALLRGEGDYSRENMVRVAGALGARIFTKNRVSKFA